jgi:hypothetical protein
MPATVQELERVPLLEVLPLEEDAREAGLDGKDELLDQPFVLRAPQPWRAPPEIQLVFEQGLVVGADVQADGQRLPGRDARSGGVQRELADRNAHAPGALITEAQDALVVGDDDEAYVAEGCAREDLPDPSTVLRRDPQPSRAPEDVAEVLACAADGRGVDDGQELLDVIDDGPVEQDLVAVLERGQPDEPLEGIALPLDVGVNPPLLLLQGAHRGGKQALEAQRDPLLGRERGALGVHGVAEQARSSVRHG